MEKRIINGKEFVRVYSYCVQVNGAKDWEKHIFFSWNDMCKYHDKHHKEINDAWIHLAHTGWENVAWIDTLRKQGFVKIHDSAEV
jgi:hypothetical protein